MANDAPEVKGPPQEDNHVEDEFDEFDYGDHDAHDHQDLGDQMYASGGSFDNIVTNGFVRTGSSLGDLNTGSLYHSDVLPTGTSSAYSLPDTGNGGVPKDGKDPKKDPSKDAKDGLTSLKDVFSNFAGQLADGAADWASKQVDAVSAWGKKQLLGIPEDAKIFYNSKEKAYGYTTQKTDDKGNTVDTVVTFTGVEDARTERTTTKNPQGQVISDSMTKEFSDGSRTFENKTFNDKGVLTQHQRSYEDAQDGGGYSRVIRYDDNGKLLDVSMSKYTDDGRVEGEPTKVTQADIDAFKAKLGPNGEKLLTQAGNGNEIFGYTALMALGEGSIDKGMERLNTFGKTPEDAVKRLKQFGSGDLEEAAHRILRVGDGKYDKGIERLTTFGGGEILKGMHRLEHLGSHSGNAGLGIENIKTLAGKYDFEVGMQNLLEIAKSNGGKNYADAIKFLDEMGGGLPEQTIKALIKFGNGDAGKVTEFAKRLGDGDAKAGYAMLIDQMADGGNMLDGVNHFHKLDRDHKTETVLAQLEQNETGCTGGVCAIKHFSRDREGRESFQLGVEARNKFDGKKTGEEHDTDLAHQNFMAFCTKPGDTPDEEPHVDMEWGVNQGLKLTQDKDGAVNGIDTADYIASIDNVNNDFAVGMDLLKKTSDHGLAGDGVDNTLATGDDGTLASAMANWQKASTDGTNASGIGNIINFSDGHSLYSGGLQNLIQIDPDGLMSGRIQDVINFGDHKNGVLNFESGTANLLLVNPVISSGIADVARFGDKHADGTPAIFRDGTANLLLVNPDANVENSERIKSVINASDVVDGKQTFAGGTDNVIRINETGKISDNIGLIINFGNKSEGYSFDGGIANLHRIAGERQLSVNIDSVKAFGDDKTFAGGSANLVRVDGERDIGRNIDSVKSFSDVGLTGDGAFDGGTSNLHRMAPDAPLSANIDRLIAFSDPGEGGRKTFDGGSDNVHRISPDSPPSANIDRVIAFSDTGAGGVHTWDGGAANITRISPTAPISANIDRVIGFGDAGAGGVRTWDGGAANIARISPTDQPSANIDRVKNFADAGTPGDRAWDGGTANLRSINPNADFSANITSVINFGDKNASGQRTWDSGTDNLRAINPNGPMSQNIQTVISFGDSNGGVKTFDGGRENIQAVNQNGTIKENIQAVASFSDRPNATFADGAQTLSRMTNSDGQMSGAIRNVQNLSTDGTFAGGTNVLRTAGNGSVERSVEAMQVLANKGEMSRAVDIVKAAGGGDAAAGFQAFKNMSGNNDVVAGARMLQAAYPNITPQQVEAMVAAGGGKLDVGFARVQQYGGLDKLASDNKGDLLAGAQNLRQQAEHAEQLRAQQEAAARNSVTVVTASLTADRSPAVLPVVAPDKPLTAAEKLVSPYANRDDDPDKKLRPADDRHPAVYVPQVVVSKGNQPDVPGYPGYSGARVTLARVGGDGQPQLSGAFVARGALNAGTLSAPATPGGPGTPGFAGVRTAGRDFADRALTPGQAQAFLNQLNQIAARFGDSGPGGRLAGLVARDALQQMLIVNAARMADARAVQVTMAAATAALARATAQEGRAAYWAKAETTQALMIHTARAATAAHLSDVEKKQQLLAGDLLNGRLVRGPDGQILVPGSMAQVVRVTKQGALISLTQPGRAPLDVRIGRYPLMGSIDALSGSKTTTLTFSGRVPRGKKLALIGAEVALMALLVSAGVARARGGDKTAAEKALAEGQFTAEQLAELEAQKQKDDDDARSKVHKYQARIRPTWLVRQGEDLCKLADHLFHDAKLGWLIADINAPNIKEMFDGKKRVVELRVRQKIELPVWQDIVEFHKLKIDFEIGDLITLVTDTAIEAELMQNSLAPVLGAAAPAPATAASPKPAAPVLQPGTAQPVAARSAEAPSTGTAVPALQAIPAALAALANAGAAIAGIAGGNSAAANSANASAAGSTPQANAGAGATIGTTAGTAGTNAAVTGARGRAGQLLKLPTLNAARLAADVTLTDRQDPTAVADATDGAESEVPAASPSLKPKYA